MLSNFNMNGRSLLQSFLLGQREFRATMRSEGFEQLRQRVIAAYHLKPLDIEETRGYVEHRLRMVGWKGDPTLRAEIFAGLFEFTAGVPRRINTLADRLLLFAYLEELRDIGPDALAEVARDIAEEQGGTTGPHNRPVSSHPRPTEQLSEIDRGGGTADTRERLRTMESNMASLTDAVREELSLLRQALLEQHRKPDGEDN